MWSKLNSEIMIVSFKNAPTCHFLAPEQEEVAKLHWVQSAAAIGDPPSVAFQGPREISPDFWAPQTCKL